MPSAALIWNRWKPWWLSVIAGAVLGCLYRLVFDFPWGNQANFPLIMTLGFLALVPLCMGYIAVNHYFRNSNQGSIPISNWLFLPWASVLLTMSVSVVVKWEGYICLIFAAPIMLVFSMIGGVIARMTWKGLKEWSNGTVSAFALPILVILLEAHIPSVSRIRTVQTEVLIRAPASVVWGNIKSVRAIKASELQDSWVNRIGFPKPVSATLSREGIGGIRQARFTGGLLFTETVERWDQDSDLSFSIHANTESIPPSTLDKHVTVGGAFFDVLDGEYRLESRPEGVLLHLSSRERISTHFNPYAGAWTDAVMRSIQMQILGVIRARCERDDLITRADEAGN